MYILHYTTKLESLESTREAYELYEVLWKVTLASCVPPKCSISIMVLQCMILSN